METFLEFFNRRVKANVKVKPKNKSLLMKSIGVILVILSKINVVSFSYKEFMEKYTTTIFSTIYSNQITETSKPNDLFLHELTHALQWIVYRMGFIFGFLLNPDKRAFYESEAHQTVMLFNFYRWSDQKIESAAKKLTKYGCDFDTSLEYLKDRREEVSRGSGRKIPQTIMMLVNEWRMRKDG